MVSNQLVAAMVEEIIYYQIRRTREGFEDPCERLPDLWIQAHQKVWLSKSGRHQLSDETVSELNQEAKELFFYMKMREEKRQAMLLYPLAEAAV